MKKYIRTKTLRVQLMRYHFLIICLIATFVSICTYITANQKTLEVAKNSQKHHVESISYRSRLAYEEMLNIILNCTERKTFDLSGINGGRTSGARKLGLDYAELIRDYCAITEYGNYIVKLSVFDDQGNLVQTGSSFGSTDDAQGIIESGWLDRELEKTMDRYQLDLESSPFSQYEGNILPIARKLEHSGSGGWAVLCLSTDLFKDMLLDTANGQETVIVTAAGDRIASIEEPGEHREENDRIIRSLQEQKKDKGLLEMKVHGKDSLVTYEIYDKSGIKYQMAENILGALGEVGFREIGVKERPGLVVLRRTRMPALLIETGFINSEEDNKLFDNKFSDIAQGIADAILGSLDEETVQEPLYYRVQTGAFRKKENADRMLYQLLEKGYPSFMLHENGLYKVQTGAYQQIGNAVNMEQRLRDDGYSTVIVTK